MGRITTKYDAGRYIYYLNYYWQYIFWETGWGGMESIHLVHDRDVRQAPVNWVMYLRVPRTMGNSWVARQLLASKGLISMELIWKYIFLHKQYIWLYNIIKKKHSTLVSNKYPDCRCPICINVKYISRLRSLSTAAGEWGTMIIAFLMHLDVTFISGGGTF
jgi:hypothetical protein